MATLSTAGVTLGSWVMLGCTLAASAQTFTGPIVGRVVDSQQSLVAGASITLRSSERDFTRHIISNNEGEYAFELVPPGRFSVRVESSGFTPTMASVDVACTNFRNARQLDPLNLTSVSMWPRACFVKESTSKRLQKHGPGGKDAPREG